MKRYHTIPLNFWVETKRICSSQEQLILLYLINHSYTNRLGCFRLPLHFIAEDLNWTDIFLKSTFNKLINAGYLIWDGNEEWGYLTGFLEWFPIRHYYQAREIERVFNTIPEACNLIQMLIGHLLEAPYLDRSFRRRLQNILKRYLPSEGIFKPVSLEEIHAKKIFNEDKSCFRPL